MKANQSYDDKFFVMADKDNDLVLINWMDGGKVEKAQYPAQITAWTYNDATKEIVLQNMKGIIQLNLGQGLRIVEMYCRFEFNEVENAVTTEDKLN